MEDLRKHEVFEMEVLEVLSREKILEPLVFGGGTMLRLCYELNRYSIDLDLWIMKKIDIKKYFAKLNSYLGKIYEITDSQIKYHTLLVELRSGNYPKRLKLEIRKDNSECDFQERIAFSRYSNKQVILKVHTLDEAMKRKLDAALTRKEIRDCFDIEFLLRRGVSLPGAKKDLEALRKAITAFKKRDYKVTLGSILDGEDRKYYSENGFVFLLQKIDVCLSGL